MKMSEWKQELERIYALLPDKLHNYPQKCMLKSVALDWLLLKDFDNGVEQAMDAIRALYELEDNPDKEHYNNLYEALNKYYLWRREDGRWEKKVFGDLKKKPIFPIFVMSYNRPERNATLDMFDRWNSQEAWFMETASDDKKEWFDKLWNKAVKLYKFGRLTTWSYLEFVKIVSGFEFEYSSLKMTDIDGSKSHRNGLLKVLGRDDLECWKALNNGIDKHDKQLCQELEERGAKLLSELKERFKNKKWKNRIGNETLESTLCTFKNCFRGRRYPNVYTDMSYDRIKKAEAVVPDVDFSIFWDIRREKLPLQLLEECNADRGGILSEKQRFFLETGKFPIMGILKDCYKIE